MTNNNDRIRQHFDRIAPDWDSRQDEQLIQRELRFLLEQEHAGGDESVLDIGCGTGVSSAALLQSLSARGRLYALDLSSQMLTRATIKIRDQRCLFLQAAVQEIPLACGSIDRCLSFSAWPHFENMSRIAQELHRVLTPGGFLHIWHHDSREAVSAIHRRIGGVIATHIFPPPDDLIHTLQAYGFELAAISDTPAHFRATFRRSSFTT